MTRVRFTPQAKTDLLAINRFIALDNPDAARRLIAAIRQQCQTLAKFPDMGRLWEELKPPLRSFPVGNYLIFYRPGSGGGIEVIAVVSGYQEIEALFATRQGN
jgi:toxin ParE1/3/4